MATILITGCAGFIGSHTAERLIAGGHRVVGIDNFRTGRAENLRALARHPNFSFHENDITVEGAMDNLAVAARPDAIIHLAALVSVPESFADPATNWRLNFDATRIVADCAERYGVKRVVFASSAAVYGQSSEKRVSESAITSPANPYGEAKLASEELLQRRARSAALSIRCLRYFNVYGARQDPSSPYSGVISIFAQRSANLLPVTVFGDGEQTRDFISVRDIARANEAAALDLAQGSHSLNICTGKGTSLLDLIRLFGRYYPQMAPPLNAPPRKGDVVHSVGDPTRARDLLGFQSGISLEVGLKDCLVSAAPIESHSSLR